MAINLIITFSLSPTQAIFKPGTLGWSSGLQYVSVKYYWMIVVPFDLLASSCFYGMVTQQQIREFL